MKKALLTIGFFLLSTSLAFSATLTVTVPNPQVQRVLDAFGYEAEVCDENGENCVANPVTATRFMQQQVVNFMKRKVMIAEKRSAVQALVIEEVEVTETD